MVQSSPRNCREMFRSTACNGTYSKSCRVLLLDPTQLPSPPFIGKNSLRYMYFGRDMGTLLVRLRYDWAVQALVLFSFMLQVFLLSFASIRRHSVSTVQRLLQWLAYQLADSVALFTLGHKAISARPWEEQLLVAFWAPFLLVQGGQDNITAYSFEDNRLWLRHLQTLVAQVMGASYVLCRYVVGKDTLLMVASMLIFVVGILKYGERIWALRSASLDTIWAGMDQQDEIVKEREQACNKLLFEALRRRWCLDAEAVLIGAHGLLDVCVGLFIGMRIKERREHVRHVLCSFKMYDRLDKLMEMELSLMYDILYTKATVIHTWCGCCVRVVALLATVTALLLFVLSSKDGHRSQDVAVTYVLLVGALLLEMLSTAMAAGSTWTRAILCSRQWPNLRDDEGMSMPWRNLHDEVLSIRRFFRATANRTWSGTVGQYNFLQACAEDAQVAAWEPPGMATARLLGLGQTAEYWWAKLRHSWYARLSDSTKELVLREILGMRGEHGELIGSRRGMQTLEKLGLGDRLDWAIQDVGFEDSIMSWHLASDVCMFENDRTSSSDDANLTKAIRVLSNYMMSLLVLRRYMLPGPVQRSRYEQARSQLHKLMQAAQGCKSSHDRLKWALRSGFHAHIHSEDSPTLYDTGLKIADVLYHRLDRLEVIFSVWVEMLCYVASNCSRESHARQLSCGGELVTIVWLMARHVDLS